MKTQTRFIRKRIRKTPYIVFYIYMLIVLLSLFSVASYTWFTLSRTPKVNNMNVYITSGRGLELATSPGADNWQTQLDIYDAEELADYRGEGTPKPSLRQTTWSDSEECFYGPIYGYDGRLMTVLSWFPLTDVVDKVTADSYYIKATIYARSGQPTDVSLAQPMAVNESGIQGAGCYLVGDPNTGRGPETAIRIGMRMTYVDSSGDALSERSPMIIYEPNYDYHVDGSTGDIPTYSVHNLTELLVDEDRLIQQSFSKSSKEPGEFQTNPVLFSLKPGEIVKIELYIWLEGQDVDCSNAMTNGVDTTRILAGIQFTGITETQSGMTPIE